MPEVTGTLSMPKSYSDMSDMSGIISAYSNASFFLKSTEALSSLRMKAKEPLRSP